MGLTQAELAAKMNTTQSSIFRFEDTRNESMTLKTLQRIAEALDCTLIVDLVPHTNITVMEKDA